MKSWNKGIRVSVLPFSTVENCWEKGGLGEPMRLWIWNRSGQELPLRWPATFLVPSSLWQRCASSMSPTYSLLQVSFHVSDHPVRAPAEIPHKRDRNPHDRTGERRRRKDQVKVEGLDFLPGSPTSQLSTGRQALQPPEPWSPYLLDTGSCTTQAGFELGM